MRRRLRRITLVLAVTALMPLVGCSSSGPSSPDADFAVSGVWPPGAGAKVSVTLTGIGFGDGSRASQVIFHNVPATEVNSWSDTEISVVVPDGIPEWSRFDVFVRTGREDSDAVTFHGLPEGWRQITDNGSDDCYHIHWGSDNMIYFSSTRAEATNFDVWSVCADGSLPTQRTFGSGIEDQPAVGPEILAYCSERDGCIDIRVHDGGMSMWLTDDEYPDYWPDINPQGSASYRVAYSKGVWNEIDQVVEHYIYASVGYGPSDAITLSGGEDIQPKWAPDGGEIAFVRDASVHKVNVWTHEETQLTSGHSDAHPDWGSGGKILWVRGQDEIWTMDGDGTNQQVFLDPPDFVMSASWSPNQEEIAMVLLLQGNMDIYVFDT